MSSNDLAEYAAGLAGDLPQEAKQALWEQQMKEALRALTETATPADVRRVLPQCKHPAERRQQYMADSYICLDCLLVLNE